MKRNALIHVTLLACGFMLSAAAVAANDAGSPRKGAFAALDKDSDGVVTRSEAQPGSTLAEKFDLYDANHDGVISLREYETATVAIGKDKAP